MSHPKYTPKEAKERYIRQLVRMLFTALRMENARVVIGLQNLIDRVAMRGGLRGN
jgi:hypothetical protein